MPELLLELFSEEIPARMQAQAARDLERMARERLTAAELAFERLRAFAGPRRLTLVVDGLPARQADRTEARRGPRANAPDKALEGFLRATGVSRDQLEARDGVYFAHIERPGRPTPELAAEMAEAIVRGLPWPKSMRWGDGTLRWVRPLKRIACLFDGAVVPFTIEGIASGDLVEGHRFMGTDRAPFAVRGFADYAAGLAQRFVVLDAEDRRRTILEGARSLCAAEGLTLVEDQGLLDEVAGLVEWPVPILGAIDAAALDLPPEVISTSMRVHQRYFAVRGPAPGDGELGKLAPRFVVVANIAPQDGGAVIAAGNARVLSARLSDARFFWMQDQRPSPDGASNFDRWLEALKGVTFHARLGTMAERVERITALAREIAPLVGADPDLAAEAARLCKADLVSAMVGEFPELQGVMGGYYARQARLDPEIADAIRDHYKPQGPSDTVPTAPVTVAVALADKLDTLVGFFAVDERPTGSRDPYALRRAALGVIRLILATQKSLTLEEHLYAAWHPFLLRSSSNGLTSNEERAFKVLDAANSSYQWKTELAQRRDCQRRSVADELKDPESSATEKARNDIGAILAFFADRLKVLLRDEGKRHDLVDAVFALGDDDLVRIVARVEALDRFLQSEDGASLLAGYKRASNILKAEAKKRPGEDYGLNIDLGLVDAPEEQRLAAALRTVAGEVDQALDREDFAGAMLHLSHLRTPVDDFFDKVLVNDADPAVRLNRLRLLSQVRGTADRIADFSLISG